MNVEDLLQDDSSDEDEAMEELLNKRRQSSILMQPDMKPTQSSATTQIQPSSLKEPEKSKPTNPMVQTIQKPPQETKPKPANTNPLTKTKTYQQDQMLNDLMKDNNDFNSDSSNEDNLDEFFKKNGIIKGGQYKAVGVQKGEQEIRQATGTGNAGAKQHSEVKKSQTTVVSDPALEKQKYLEALMNESDDDEDDEEEKADDDFIQSLNAKQFKNALAGGKSTVSAEEIEKQKRKQQMEEQQAQQDKIKFLLNQDIMEVIEKSEKMNKTLPEKVIEQANHLLSFDNKFYNVKKKLFFYQEYSTIAKKLHAIKDHQLFGIVSCIQMFKIYLFVGNSQGIIRIFDIQTQKEIKPLMDDQLIRNKVTCIDITPDGNFLLSGYKRGQVALWDLKKCKLLKMIPDMHTSEVTNAKIYGQGTDDTLFAVTSEDHGSVSYLELTKKSFLGGYSFFSQFLFKSRLKGTASMAIQKRNELYPHAYVDKSQLVAFGACNEIVVCSMKPIKDIFSLSKPTFCRQKSIPYLDWGYGLTPSHRDRTVPILAFAWDRLIQLIYFDHESNTIEIDGLYYSDQEISQLFFLGESVIMILVGGKEIKLLYTTKFFPGNYKFLESADKDQILNNEFERVTSITAFTELEKGHEVPEIRTSILSQKVMNYNQSVTRFKNNIFFMGNKTIVHGRLFSWKEYLEHIKFKENYDWLTVLKTALEIYNGELKGYTKVPDEKEIREGVLKAHMRDMIKDSINTVIYNYSKNKSSGTITQEGMGDDQSYQADAIAIKVAIEFCLTIQSTTFLFTEIFDTFIENGLADKFIQNLEPFILSGQFRKEIVPHKILKKVLLYYEEKGNLRVMEKIIQQLDLTEYPWIEELEVTCHLNCMAGALLYLQTRHNEDGNIGCMQILNTMFKLMMAAEKRENELRIQKNQKPFTKDDVRTISLVDSQKKYEIEKSKAYIRYKLLWIMKTYLEGKQFPFSKLSTEKWRAHTYDIVQQLTIDELIDDLIQFDSKEVFRIIELIFYDMPYIFLLTQKEFYEANKIMLPLCMEPLKFIELIHRKIKKSKNQEILSEFYTFLLRIEVKNGSPENCKMLAAEKKQPINIDYLMIMDAIKNELNKDSKLVNEKLLINAIRSKRLQNYDIKQIYKLLDENVLALTSLRIYLLEKQRRFVESFQMILLDTDLKKNIFKWIREKMDKLNGDDEYSNMLKSLKEEISKQIKELIELNVDETIELVEKQFDEQYQESLIIYELQSHPRIQYDYLRRFITQFEDKIQTTILESYNKDKQQQAQRYQKYLALFTKLMCDYSKLEVEDYVRRDYFPVGECLRICKEKRNLRGEAVLVKRNGNFLQAIQIYLSMVEATPLHQLALELQKLLGGSSASNQANLITSSNKWNIGEQHNMKVVNEFDYAVEKACKIAQKIINNPGSLNQGGQEYSSDEGWFTIGRFLNKYLLDVRSNYASQLNDDSKIDKNNVERLKDFISKRNNDVLQRLPRTIQIQKVMKELSLDFRQLKKLYDYQVMANKNDQKYYNLVNNIMEFEINQVSDEIQHRQMKGFSVENQGKCLHCEMPLTSSISRVPFRIFACGHAYHQGCIKDPEKCSLCDTQKVEIHRDLKKTTRGKKRGAQSTSTNADSSSDRDGSLDSRGGDSSNYAPSSRFIEKSSTLLLKKLEQFDLTLEQTSLTQSNFKDQ